MVETAAHLADHVIPRLPVRQWVLAVPKRLRYHLARERIQQGAKKLPGFSQRQECWVQSLFLRTTVSCADTRLKTCAPLLDSASETRR